MGWIIPGIIIGLFVLFIAFAVKIVPQSEAYVIERLGSYHKTMEHGLHIIVPFIDRIAKKTTLKEIVLDFPPQAVITRDNVTMQIDTVVYFRVLDPKLYTYGVHVPVSAVENLTATTLRNIIGELELDETLTSRDTINTRLRSVLDEATDPWGIKIIRVELKNILPPRDIQEAMEKQMRAEREKREKILRAEGEKEAKILTAEGQKEAMLLGAIAQKQANILAAEGEAEAQRKLYDAEVYGMNVIKKADVSEKYLKLQTLKALAEVADGNATKLIIPSELQNIVSLASAARESLDKIEK